MAYYQQLGERLKEIKRLKAERNDAQELLAEVINGQLVEAIFGSNAIENVGGSFRTTDRLCRIVFRGKTTNVDFDACETETAEEIDFLAQSGRSTSREAVIASRHEIVQHALAMKYLIDVLVIDKRTLDEVIIKEAHRILMQYSEHEGTGGIYRTSDEAASHGLRLETDEEYETRVKDAKRLKPDRSPPERKTKPHFYSKFVRGASVPIYMKKLVEEFTTEFLEGEENGNIPDPMELATKYCNFFVCIHPFEDGNGRMCRMVMNAILLYYMGTCVAIGVELDEREWYIQQACTANKAFTKQEHDDIPWSEQTSHHALWNCVKEKIYVGLGKLRDRLRVENDREGERGRKMTK